MQRIFLSIVIFLSASSSYAMDKTCHTEMEQILAQIETIVVPRSEQEVLSDLDFQKQLTSNPAEGKKLYWFHYGRSTPSFGGADYYSADPTKLFNWDGRLFVMKLAQAIKGNNYHGFSQEITGRHIDWYAEEEPVVLYPIEIMGIPELKQVIAHINSELNRDAKGDWVHNTNSVANEMDLKRFFVPAEPQLRIRYVIDSWQAQTSKEESLKNQLLYGNGIEALLRGNQ